MQQRIGILNSLPSDVKYIFIDEISVVKNFVHCSGTLADNYTLDGEKVVVAGTDSYAIECAFGDGLFHRCIMHNVTFIYYKEYVRTIGGSLRDYLTSGGLYEASKYQEDFKENNIKIVSRKILYMGKTDREHGLVNCKEFLENVGDLSSILL